MRSTTSTDAGSQTRCRSLRDRSTSMTCSERSLGSTSELLGRERLVLLRRCPAGPGPGDRVRDDLAALDLDQRLGAGADDVDRAGRRVAEPEQIHVRAGVRGAQHPVDVERVGRARRGEPLATARPGRPHRRGSPPCRSRPSPRTPRACGCWTARTGRGRAGSAGSMTAIVAVAGCGQGGGHAVQAPHGVRVRLVDPLVGVVEVHRVGDEVDRAVGVVQHRQVGGQHHRQLGQAQVVGRLVRAGAPTGGRRRSRRTPTNPPVSGGSPAMGSVASAASASRSTSTGLPCGGMPTGTSPSQQRPPVALGQDGAATRRR